MKDGISRRFGFVGLENESEAQRAMMDLNNTYIDTSQIKLDLAKIQDDPSLPRAWSRHTKGSTQYSREHKNEQEE
jgi:multiple RNA-binding domain-containing protein 1